jgi:hypothetical protein
MVGMDKSVKFSSVTGVQALNVEFFSPIQLMVSQQSMVFSDTVSGKHAI